jgi:serine/threonine-protein kinase
VSLLGTWIGGYVVERKLGEGGMGEVYEARNPQIDERLAIKLLHAELTTRNDIKARFVQEAVAAAKVKHDNVVEVRDVATLPDGRVYIALEFLEGKDLEGYVAQLGGRLGEHDVVLIIGQVCCALHEAHLKGIVHRDLKPANVFITSDRRRPILVKLLDFGIAHVKNAVKSNTLMTGDKQVLGTPAYMAPEQIVSPRSVDQRADIFALGCMLYQLLTGRLPFDAETLEALVIAKREQRPWPPTSLVPGLSPIWDVIVARCLGWDPNTRYPNVHSLVLDIVDGTHGPNGPCAGVDGADAILREIWPDYRRIASEGEETRRAHGSIGATAPMSSPGALTTSISGAAGERMRSAAVPRRSGRLVVIGAAVAAGVAASVMIAAKIGGSSHATDRESTPATSPSPPPTSAGPSAAPSAGSASPAPTSSAAPRAEPAPSATAPAKPPAAPSDDAQAAPTATKPASSNKSLRPKQPRDRAADNAHVSPKPAATAPVEPKSEPPKAKTPPKHVDPDGVM